MSKQKSIYSIKNNPNGLQLETYIDKDGGTAVIADEKGNVLLALLDVEANQKGLKGINYSLTRTPLRIFFYWTDLEPI